MKQIKLIVLAFFTLAIAGTANAQDQNNPWVIGLGVNVLDVVNTDSVLRDLVGPSEWLSNTVPSISRVSVDRYFNNGLSAQLALSVNKIKTFIALNDSNITYYSFDAALKYDLNEVFGNTGWFDPYVNIGGSYQSVSNEGGAAVVAGVGFNTWFNDSLGLNFQTNYKATFNKAPANNYSNHFFQHSIGLVFKFGGKDTDKDGVYDKFDACPETPGLKEFNGCPDADDDGIKDSDDACPNVAGLEALNGCPDTDGDGIADKDDMCPNAKGTKANKGCPDADGDSVVDKDDKCANVAGPAVNGGCPWPDTDGDGVLDKDDTCVNEAGPASNGGCPLPKKISEDKEELINFYAGSILFNTGKASLVNNMSKELDAVAEVMIEYDGSTFSIAGHTDSIGSYKANLKLSIERANAVKDYLVSKGVDASRLSTEGFGEKKPIATNMNRKGRKANRRVVIKTSN